MITAYNQDTSNQTNHARVLMEHGAQENREEREMLITIYHGDANRLTKTFRAEPEKLGETCYRAFVSLDVAARLNHDRQGIPVAVIGPIDGEMKAFVPYRSKDGGKSGVSVCIGTSLAWPKG